MTTNNRQRIDKIEHITRTLTHQNYSFKTTAWQTAITVSIRMKRLFDFVASLILLIIFIPFLIVTSLAIYLETPGPVFYTQKRVGKNGHIFSFFKFRSMKIDADKMKDQIKDLNESEDGVLFKIKEDPRVTKTGRFIRKFSIDELPQLLNVLLGDMSLVGPRPALPAEVAQYTLEQRKRLHVTPGITCIWQISGRSDIPFTGQVKLDTEYIANTSLAKDLLILLKTIPAVLTGKGAY